MVFSPQAKDGGEADARDAKCRGRKAGGIGASHDPPADPPEVHGSLKKNETASNPLHSSRLGLCRIRRAAEVIVGLLKRLRIVLTRKHFLSLHTVEGTHFPFFVNVP